MLLGALAELVRKIGNFCDVLVSPAPFIFVLFLGFLSIFFRASSSLQRIIIRYGGDCNYA